MPSELPDRSKSSKIIVRENTEDALAIIRESAEWLVSKGMPLWDPSDFDSSRVDKAESRKYQVAYLERVPIAAMILQWEDREYWPDAEDDSGFIHKLSVRRAYAGQGFVQELIEWAKLEVVKQERSFLRLDCDANREKLRRVYEKMGFVEVDRRMVGSHFVAFFEIDLRDSVHPRVTDGK